MDSKAVKHQGFVVTSYFDAIQNKVTAGTSSTTAMKGSAEITSLTRILIPNSIAKRIGLKTQFLS
jgi:hypothetical protein